MRLRAVSVGGVSAIMYAGGCSLITSYDGFSGGALAVNDATMVPVAEAGPPDFLTTLCSPDVPPNPGGDAPVLQGSPVYTGVVSALRFITEDGGCPLGKNLDGLNTCADAGPACIAEFTDGGGGCDRAGGVDNAAQPLLIMAASETTESIGATTELGEELPADLAAQRSGFVLVLSNYGGELNNPAVGVAYQSDVGVTDGGTLVDEASIAHHNVVTQTSSAYVNNGVLVAPFDNAVPLHFSVIFTDNPGVLASAVIPISHAMILGHPVLDANGGLTMNDAQLVGRVESADLINALTSFYACVNQTNAPIVCPLLDLPASPSDDGRGGPCDAISIAVGFDTVPTTIAGVATAVPTVDLCGANSLPVSPNLCGVPAGDD